MGGGGEGSYLDMDMWVDDERRGGGGGKRGDKREGVHWCDEVLV